MMFLMECLIICVIFTIWIVGATYKNPVKQLFNYPPKIIDRVKSLPEYEGRIPEHQSKAAVKLCGVVVFILLLSAVAYMSGATTFFKALRYTYGLWIVVDWYDAFVLDIGIFAHVKRFRLPGTEDMVEEYTDHWFYIKGALRGMILGIPVCLCAAGLAALLSVLHI